MDFLYGTDNLTAPRDLSTPSADELVGRCRDLIKGRELDTIIVAAADLSGVLRGKSVAADRFADDPLAPVGLSDLALVLDVRGEVIVRPKHFEGWWPSGETTGHEDVVIVPDLETLRALPWSEGTGIVLAEFRLSGRRSVARVAVLGAPACARSGDGTRPQPTDGCRA